MAKNMNAKNANNKISITKDTNSPDPSWKDLYKAGGISAILYVIIAVIVPFFIYISNPKFSYIVNGTDIADILKLIASNKILWIVLQTTVLGTSFFAIITFVALFVALKHLNKSYALIGTTITITCHILFIAYYPILMGLTYLGEHYNAEIQSTSLATAAEALLAINNAFNPLYESVFAISILIISLVMLKGVFHKRVAYLGIVTAISAFIALLLWPILGIGYFWWWLLFMIWFIAVGWKLYKLSKIN